MSRKRIKTISMSLLASAILTAPALADWRSDMGVFRVGISALHGEPPRKGSFDLFRKHLSETLNMPVEIFQANDASALIDAVAASRIEYAILPTAGYATLDAFCSCLVPIAAPMSENGADSVRSVFITNQKIIASLNDIDGRKIAVGPVSSLTGFMLPHAFFRPAKKQLGESGAQIVQTANQFEAVRLFQAGKVDGFFAWEHAAQGTEKRYENEFLNIAGQVSDLEPAVLWRSEAVLYGPHTVRKNLPKEAMDAIRDALISMNEKEPLAYDSISPELGGGMQAVSKEDYNVASQMVRTLAEQ